MSKRISTLAKEADRALIRLGKERDKLRTLLDEVEESYEEADEAIGEITSARDSLLDAADTLSKRV